MKILKNINMLVLSPILLSAVACSSGSKSTKAQTTTKEPVQVQKIKSKPAIDNTTIEAADSVMTEAIDSVSAEG